MKLDLTALSLDPQWYEYRQRVMNGDGQPAVDQAGEPLWEVCRFLIRPQPTSENTLVFRDGAIELGGKAALQKFLYCLVDWQGLEDAQSGKPIICTEHMKRQIFESPAMWQMRDFVIRTIQNWERQKETEEKN